MFVSKYQDGQIQTMDESAEIKAKIKKKQATSDSVKCLKCRHILKSHTPVKNPYDVGGKCTVKSCKCKGFLVPPPSPQELTKFYEE